MTPKLKVRLKNSQQPANANAEFFSFDEAKPVLSQYDFLYAGCWDVQSKYYEPPIDLAALTKVYRATAHHGSAIQVKRNMLLRTFQPSRFLSRMDFSRLVLDYLILGNSYPTLVNNRLGGLSRVKASLAKYVRRGTDLKSFYWVDGWKQEVKFKKDSVLHLMEPDINQEIYGVPDYLGAMQGILLNESATLFRRRYYENGSHAGFILYMTDAAQDKQDVDNLREALKGSKGLGNFKNAFMYAPNGKKDGLQLIPVSEVAAKDEFLNIKNVSREDELAGHRMPPQLMGVVPNNTGGFGDVEKAAMVCAANEIEPLQSVFLEINELTGEQVVAFGKYTL